MLEAVKDAARDTEEARQQMMMFHNGYPQLGPFDWNIQREWDAMVAATQSAIDRVGALQDALEGGNWSAYYVRCD